MSSIDKFGHYLDRIAGTSGRNDKTALVSDMLDEPEWEEMITFLAGQRFEDNGIATKTAVNAASRAFGISKKVLNDEISDAGTLTEALKDYTGGPNGRLSQLVAHNETLAEKSGKDAERYLLEMFKEFARPDVVSYSVLHDWKFGVSKNTIASAAAVRRSTLSKSDEKRARALYPDMVEFVTRIKSGQDIIQPKIGKPFKPQLASSSTSQLEKVEGRDNWVGQFKLDGHRCLIHIQRGEVRAFSRALNEKTGVLPELQDIDWPDGDYILDAEVMARNGGYTETSERLKSDPDRENLPNEMRFFLFDIIVDQGQDISQKRYEQRYRRLSRMAPDEHENVAVIPIFEDIAFARKMAENYGYEGLILKNLDSEYEFGEREKESWVKMKFTEETVDLRVKDIEEGTGRNAGRLGGMVLETEDGVAVGNVGTGFSDEQREHFWDRDDLIVGSIVEVSFDAAAGYQDGLRFPRFEGKRPEKKHADTAERLEEIAG